VSTADHPTPEPVNGRYQIVGVIAQGRQAVVYHATDLAIGREVVVKVLREAAPAGPVTVGRFIEEAQITGQLQHPGIPPLHDVGTLPDGRPFLVMKLIKGRTLDAILEERPGPTAEFCCCANTDLKRG
jgi:serine/threonine-protein kinase